MGDKFLTSQQELFLSEYLNPKGVNFGNALRSALKAGYSQEYSESITHQMPDWLSENLGDMRRLRKAEKVLDDTLDMDTEVKDPLGSVTTSPALVKVKQDTAKFVAERIGKNKYSTRKELTGSGGERLFKPSDEEKEKIDEALDTLNGSDKENT
jgi:hypothetical protein